VTSSKLVPFLWKVAELFRKRMSDEPVQNGGPPDEVETEEAPKPKSGDEAKAARSMDAMQANQPTVQADVDDTKLASAMTSLAGGAKAKKVDEPIKKVVLKKEDVTVIMTEFEMSRTAAEKALRQNQGQLIPTINQLIHV